MRLTKAQKAKAAVKNAIDMAHAKTEQVRRHNAELQALNERLRTQYAELATENAGNRAKAEVCAKAVDVRDGHIAAFKQEVLALTTQVAEMRGYIGRVLEDDHVREDNINAEPAGKLAANDRHTLLHALAADDRASQTLPMKHRSGPDAMRGVWAESHWDGVIASAPTRTNPLGQMKHWLQR